MLLELRFAWGVSRARVLAAAAAVAAMASSIVRGGT